MVIGMVTPDNCQLTNWRLSPSTSTCSIYIGQGFHSSISWFSISNVNAGASLSKQKVKRQILFQLFMLLVKFHGEAGRSFPHFRD